MANLEKIKQFSRNLPFKHLIGGFVFLFMTLALFHSTSRVGKLEKRSSEHDVQLSKRSTQKKVIVTKTIVAPGAIYTRWGRSECPKTSSLVYEGIAGGQYYSHTGGASNILCLPNDPLWGNFTSAGEGAAYIYGSEYEVSMYRSLGINAMFSKKNAPSLHNHNVPCSVCLTKHPSSVMMLPARNRCYPGWIMEYTGYLMTSHYAHKGRTSYLCFDKDPEADPSGYRDENGALFYPVQSGCGSLSCPPYVANRELTCSVCSKISTPM